MSASAKPTEKVFKSFLAAVLAISLCPLMPAEKAQAEEAGDSSEPTDAAQVADEGEGGDADPTEGALAADGSDADSELAGENDGAEDESATDDSNVALQAANDSGAPIVNWTKCGTCQWMIDSSGCLIIEPQSGETGELEDWTGSKAPWLEYKSSIVSAKIKKTVIAKTTSRAFFDCKSLRSVDLSGLDASKATNMSSMFSGCSSLASLDLSGLDTSSATGMSYMFDGCSSLRTVALGEKFSFEGAKGSRQCSLPAPSGDGLTGRWVSSADGVAYPAGEVPSGVAATYAAQREDGGEWMVSGTCVWRVDGEGCLTVRPRDGFSEGVLTSWAYSSEFYGVVPPWYDHRESIVSARFEGSVSAGTAQGMFSGCSSLSSLDLSGLDTSKTTNMSSMFSGCSSLSSLDLSPLDTSSATDMSYMFSGCSSLASLDLSPLDTSSATSMSNMFYGCSSLRTVALGEKFSFEGAKGSRQCSLPAPEGDGLTGRWVSSADGIAYPAGEVPSAVAATYAAQREDGGEWNGSGTCAWRVDASGCLTVRPLPGLEEGALGTWSGTPPWYGLRGSIESARFEGSVSAGTARRMFDGCSSLCVSSSLCRQFLHPDFDIICIFADCRLPTA